MSDAITHATAGEVDRTTEALVGTRPFGDLSEPQRRAVAEAGDVVVLEAGATVLRAGEACGSLYVLLAGSCSVLVTVGDEHVEVGTLETGDLFGELGLLTASPRSATVVATRPTQLLELSAATIEQLLAQDGAYGLALARDLAGRLAVAMGEGNAELADAGPATIALPAQDLSRMRSYQSRYYASAARNLVKRHRLLVDRAFPRYRTTFRVTAQDHAGWHELFGVEGDAGRATPFTFHTSSGTLLLMRIVQDVGVNFRHLLHLRSEIALHPGGRRIEPDVEHVLEATLADVVALAEDRVALVVETRVHAPDDELLELHREVFVILEIDPDAVHALRESGAYGTTRLEGIEDLTSREPSLDGGASAVTVDIAHDMGLRYGKVSGDLNVVHTTKVAAKMFGHPRPFVQGLCTANNVLLALTRAHDTAVQHLEISFARRIFVGSQIEIRFADGVFEVLEERGKLAAFGSYGVTAPAAG